MARSKEMQEFLEGTFPEEMQAVKEKKCPFCGHAVGDYPEFFRDELSRKEFRISGLCQRCQDDTFGK